LTEYCPDCNGRARTSDVGVCSDCVGTTASGANKVCAACSKKLGVCKGGWTGTVASGSTSVEVMAGETANPKKKNP
jgi:hypothetical protein